MKKWTSEEIDFLSDNYPINGVKYCSEQLNRGTKCILTKVSRMKLKLSKEKRTKMRSVSRPKQRCNYSNFFDCKSIEFCYLLGYMWADGYLSNNSVILGIVEKDGLIIRPILDRINIHYTLQIKKAKIGKDGSHRQAQYYFRFGVELMDFLKSLNYGTKSYCSHQKIMEYIPLENLHYWVRGYSDGDGCFYYNKKWGLKQFSIASSYEQDWSYFENFLLNKEISYQTQKRTHLKSKSSYIRLSGIDNVSKFGNFIYQGEQFGLYRKYEKFLLIKLNGSK